MKIPNQDNISKLNTETYKFNIGKKDDIELLRELYIYSEQSIKNNDSNCFN